MTAHALFRELSVRGIRLVLCGDRLYLRGQQQILTADFTERLRQIKPQLLETVRRSPACVECGATIGPDEPETWLGADRVRLDCGRRA